MPIKLLGRLLLKRKIETDRKLVHGIYLGAPPKLLEEKDLLCGDVLFCGDTSDQKKGKIIREVSAGNYVHCGLYIGNGEVVDIVATGIRSPKFKDFVEKYSYIAVTRCPGNEQFPERRQRIAEFARKSNNGSVEGYSKIKAGLSPIKELWDLINLNKLWSRNIKPNPGTKPPRYMFCSEFIIEAYIDCGYIPRGYPFLQADRRTPNGLAEDGIFRLIGYVSRSEWNGVSPDDHFLGGCGWVVTEEGRERLKKREQMMRTDIQRNSVPIRHSKTRKTDKGRKRKN